MDILKRITKTELSIMNEVTIKLSYIYCFLIIVLALQKIVYGQELTDIENNQNTEFTSKKRNFISINPIKPFIGLPNLQYEFQVRKKLGVTAFSEILAYTVIPNFNHPDAVNTIGFSYYPFMGSQTINQGAFVNVNTSYVVNFRDNSKSNSFANGVQIGYKWLLAKSIFLEPKLVLNYIYQEKNILPGFEVLVGINI